MKDNKYKMIELFVYIVIVIIGLALLLFSKEAPEKGGGMEPPPGQTIIAERSEPDATLPDE